MGRSSCSRSSRSSSAQPFALTCASNALPRVMANCDCPTWAGNPACIATRCLSTPAASSTARRAQPRLLVNAAMVRALWSRAGTAPRMRSRRLSVSFTALPSRGKCACSGIGSGTGDGPQPAPEKLLYIGQLSTGTASGCLAVGPVRVLVDLQLDLGGAGYHGGLHRVEAFGGTGDVRGELPEQPGRRGPGSGDTGDVLSHRDGGGQEVDARAQRTDDPPIHRPGRNGQQAPGRRQQIGGQCAADVVRPGEGGGGERAFLIAAQAGQPGAENLPAEEGVVYRDDQFRCRRYGQQRQRLVNLFPDRKQRTGLPRSHRCDLGRCCTLLEVGQRLLPCVLGLTQHGAKRPGAYTIAAERRPPHFRPQLVDALLQLLNGLCHAGHRTVTQSFPAIPSLVIVSNSQATDRYRPHGRASWTPICPFRASCSPSRPMAEHPTGWPPSS